jgi:WD40 repeat protein
MMSRADATEVSAGIRPVALLQCNGSIAHAAWSADGSRLAAAVTGGAVRVWETPRGTPPSPGRNLRGSERSAAVHVAWSSRAALAIASPDAIRIWTDPGTPSAKAERLDPGGHPIAMAWSPDGRELNCAILVGTYPRQRLVLRTWSPAQLTLIDEIENRRWDGAFVGVSSARHLLGLALAQGTLEVWSLEHRRRLHRVAAAYRPISALAIAPRDKSLVVAWGGAIEQWGADGRRLPPLAGESAVIYSLTFSPSGEVLAAKSSAGWVRLWLWPDRTQAAEIAEPSVAREQRDLAFDPSREQAAPRFVSFSQLNSALRVWEIAVPDLRWSPQKPKTILFLSADPSHQLSISEEIHELKQNLSLTRHRDKFTLELEVAVRPEDISRALQEYSPQIVHFAGHGTSSGDLVVEKNGAPHLLPAAPLARLFALFADRLQCVVLNACYSEIQAKAIAAAIDHVIGMSAAVKDEAAIAFAIGFYQALGEGATIPEAYRLGCVQIGIQAQPGDDVPVLYQQGRIVSREAPPRRQAARAAGRRR